MKSILPATLTVLLALATSPAIAGASASGRFQFGEDDAVKTIEFDGRTFPNGRSNGDITITGLVVVPTRDEETEGEIDLTPRELSLKVEVDCLVQRDNRAVLSGLVTSASIDAYVGRRAILAVEDNGEDEKGPKIDKFSWGLYRSTSERWIASDSELESDGGVGISSWTATDAERPDDKGVESKKSDEVNCQSFSLVSHSLQEVTRAGGTIEVRP